MHGITLGRSHPTPAGRCCARRNRLAKPRPAAGRGWAGLRPLDLLPMVAKNQHYLPQFLLREFASRRSGGEAYIHVFRKGVRSFESSVRNVGAEGYFYSKERANEVEQALSRHEEDHAQLLRRLPADGDVPNADQPNCAAFVAQLLVGLVRRPAEPALLAVRLMADERDR